MIMFIEYPKCSTCKKAKQWLMDNSIEFKTRHIVEDTLTVDELNCWIEKSGLDIKKWFNTSGIKYRELNLKERLKDLSDEEKIDMLASDGMLIKRPILISDDNVLVGFSKDKWENALF